MNVDDNIEIRSEEVQEILSTVPVWIIRYGNALILFVIIFLLVSAYFIRYPETVNTNITVTTLIPPEKIIARNSGKIQEIFIKNNEYVSENTPLAIIENAASTADVFKLKNIIDSISFTQSSFCFPIERLNNLRLGDIESSFVIFQKNYLLYRLNYDLNHYQVDGKAHVSELQQAIQRLNVLKDQIRISEDEGKIKAAELERFKQLFSKGVISASEWDARKLDFLSFQKESKNLKASLIQTQSSINEINKLIKNNSYSEQKDMSSLYSNTIQSLNLLKKSIIDWHMNFVLQSSTPGIVSYQRIWTKNQVVKQGDMIFSIVPKDSKNYLGIAQADLYNSGKIKKGQNVNIRLLNYPEEEFGILKGIVDNISLSPDSNNKLIISISFPNGLHTSYSSTPVTFQQEMQGDANIIVDNERLLFRIFKGFKNLIK